MVCVDSKSENLSNPLFYPAGAAIKAASSHLNEYYHSMEHT